MLIDKRKPRGQTEDARGFHYSDGENRRLWRFSGLFIRGGFSSVYRPYAFCSVAQEQSAAGEKHDADVEHEAVFADVEKVIMRAVDDVGGIAAVNVGEGG